MPRSDINGASSGLAGGSGTPKLIEDRAGNGEAGNAGRTVICLAWSLRERTERGVYAASAWLNTCDVSALSERQESADGEAA